MATGAILRKRFFIAKNHGVKKPKSSVLCHKEKSGVLAELAPIVLWANQTGFESQLDATAFSGGAFPA